MRKDVIREEEWRKMLVKERGRGGRTCQRKMNEPDWLEQIKIRKLSR